MTDKRARPALNLAIAAVMATVLGGCAGGSQQAALQEPGVTPATVRADQIVGRWGVASYQDPKDRTRVEAAAKAQCPGSSRGWVRRSGVADHGGIQNLNPASRESRSIQPQLNQAADGFGGGGLDKAAPSSRTADVHHITIALGCIRIDKSRYQQPTIDGNDFAILFSTSRSGWTDIVFPAWTAF